MQTLSFEDFSELVGQLYEGPLESIPWVTFLNQLNSLLHSKYVTFILRPPSTQVDGLMVSTTGTSSDATASYNKHFFALDPFVGLPNREVVALADFMPEAELKQSEFFRNFRSRWMCFTSWGGHQHQRRRPVPPAYQPRA